MNKRKFHPIYNWTFPTNMCKTNRKKKQVKSNKLINRIRQNFQVFRTELHFIKYSEYISEMWVSFVYQYSFVLLLC